MIFKTTKLQCETILRNIIFHLFNQELASGTLSHEVFCYYIEQDIYYLEVYAQAFALIAAKIAKPYRQIFIEFCNGIISAEKNMVHDFFKDQIHFKSIGERSLATEAYTDFLLASASFQPVEVAVAAVLPCFWVYWEVAVYYKKHILPDNIYSNWFEVYASDEFDSATQKAILIFDELATLASDSVRYLMRQAFRKACFLEWHFWNDAYEMRNFEFTYANIAK